MKKRYKVSEYTDTTLGEDGKPCRWIIRWGNGVKYWALTTCKRGFNPLRGDTVEQVEEQYNDRCCPICGRPIWIDTCIVSEVQNEADKKQ